MRYVRQLVIFFLLLVACSFLIFSTYTAVEEKTVAQVNNEQMVHAEQAAQGILRFFSTYNSTLSFLAGNDHIITTDDEGRHLIRDFYTSHSGEISSVTRVDENGIILYTYPFESSTGANISGQAHVKKSMDSHNVVISDVFTSVQGFRTISVSMPVFEEGTYKGSLSILVPFDSLARKNLEPVRILESGHAWTISENGVILYSPVQDRIDKNARTEFLDSPTLAAFITLALQGEKGASSYMISTGQTDGNMVTYEAVFYPVRIGDTHWSIIVATPRQEILATLQTFRRDLAIIFGVLVASLFFFTYYIAVSYTHLRRRRC